MSKFNLLKPIKVDSVTIHIKDGMCCVRGDDCILFIKDLFHDCMESVEIREESYVTFPLSKLEHLKNELEVAANMIINGKK